MSEGSGEDAENKMLDCYRCKVDVRGSSLQMYCIFQSLGDSSGVNLGPFGSNNSFTMTHTVHEQLFRMLPRYGSR